jgi:hypothetical protein
VGAGLREPDHRDQGDEEEGQALQRLRLGRRLAVEVVGLDGDVLVTRVCRYLALLDVQEEPAVASPRWRTDCTNRKRT